MKALWDSEAGKNAELSAQERDHLAANIKQRIAELDAMIGGESA